MTQDGQNEGGGEVGQNANGGENDAGDTQSEGTKDGTTLGHVHSHEKVHVGGE